MPKYDPEKDKVTHEVGEVPTEAGSIVVRVFSYNGGEPKVGVNRTWLDNNGDQKFKNLGRLTRDEADALAPLLTQAAMLIET